MRITIQFEPGDDEVRFKTIMNACLEGCAPQRKKRKPAKAAESPGWFEMQTRRKRQQQREAAKEDRP